MSGSHHVAGSALYDPAAEHGDQTALDLLLAMICVLAGNWQNEDEAREEIYSSAKELGGSVEMAKALYAVQHPNINAIEMAHKSYLALCDEPNNPILQHCFCQIAPVLILWHDDLNEDRPTCAGVARAWMHGLPWDRIVGEAVRRDSAAAQLMAGGAFSDSGAIYAVLPGEPAPTMQTDGEDLGE